MSCQSVLCMPVSVLFIIGQSWFPKKNCCCACHFNRNGQLLHVSCNGCQSDVIKLISYCHLSCDQLSTYIINININITLLKNVE